MDFLPGIRACHEARVTESQVSVEGNQLLEIIRATGLGQTFDGLEIGCTMRAVFIEEAVEMFWVDQVVDDTSDVGR